MAGRCFAFFLRRSAAVYSLVGLVYGVPLPLQTSWPVGEFARTPKGGILFIFGAMTNTRNDEGEIDSSEQAMRGFGSGPPISDRTQCGRTPGGPPPIDHC